MKRHIKDWAKEQGLESKSVTEQIAEWAKVANSGDELIVEEDTPATEPGISGITKVIRKL